MAKTVKRDKDGKITHVRILEGIYLSVKDEKTFREHKVTNEEIDGFFGDDDRPTLREELRLIANGEYEPDMLRFNIMSYNDLFTNKIVRE
jgi:hypothetical protein